MVRRQFHVTVGPDEEDSHVGHLARDETEEQDRRRICGVQVVEDDQQRRRRRSISQECRRRIEQLEACQFRLRDRRRRKVGEEFAQLRQHLRDVTCPGPKLRSELTRRDRPQVRAKRLDPGPVGGRPGALPATAPEHLVPAVARPRCEFVRQSALADARLATEQDDAPTPGSGLLERLEHLPELAIATDEHGSCLHLPPDHCRACAAAKHTDANRRMDQRSGLRDIGPHSRSVGSHA